MLGLGNALKKVKSLVPKVVNVGKKAVKSAVKKVTNSALLRAVASIPSALKTKAVQARQITRKAVAAIPKILEPIRKRAVQIKNTAVTKANQIKNTVVATAVQAKETVVETTALVNQVHHMMGQKLVNKIVDLQQRNGRILDKLKAEWDNTSSDLINGVITAGAFPNYYSIKTSSLLLDFLLKSRRAVLEEYPILEWPLPQLRGGLDSLRSEITEKGAAAGSYIYKQNLPGLSDFVGAFTDQRDPDDESNLFSVSGAIYRGIWVKGALGTVDGIASLVTDPFAAVEGLNSIVAHPEEVAPVMCEGVKTFWNEKIVEGSAEDRAEVVGQAVFEVATYFIGVGEAKAGMTAGSTVTKTAKLMDKADDLADAGKIAKSAKVASKTAKIADGVDAVSDTAKMLKAGETIIGRSAVKLNKTWLKNLGKTAAKNLDEAVIKAGRKTGDLIDNIRWAINRKSGPKPAFAGIGGIDSLSNSGDAIEDYYRLIKKSIKNSLDNPGGHKVNIKPKVEADDIPKPLKKSGDGPGIGNKGTGKTVSSLSQDTINHSTIGDFTYNPKTGAVSKVKGGGHGQANIDFLEENGIPYNIEKTYDNGVRIGNIPDHKNPLKRIGTSQSWFPETWDTTKINNAGEYVVELHKGETITNGAPIYGIYDGVEVGVIYTNGKPATIFPNGIQP
ncbi:EndoU domain-containing protein [Clostridium sp. E02]|uniref:EndoU domain-containing protein n=1 Tax=Clostridium sp. E02 TaxID=2487134 RepID=UPI0019D18E88|nr:EndoU domain-containing protein [Clostridium sp. E02]